METIFLYYEFVVNLLSTFNFQKLYIFQIKFCQLLMITPERHTVLCPQLSNKSMGLTFCLMFCKIYHIGLGLLIFILVI